MRGILTVPNGVSVARLLGVPLFLWLILLAEADVWAFVVLVLGEPRTGSTDTWRAG